MIDRLIESICAKKNPTVVGLDPRLSMIPDFIKEEAYEGKPESLEGIAKAFFLFNKAIIDETFDLIPAVKPQIAMYERYGAPGVQAFIDTVAYAKSKGLIVIGDGKRNDIASTAEAYADAHIGSVEVDGKPVIPFDEDFLTVNPYMGSDSITPFFKAMRQYDRGLFVLVKTSNPSSGDMQDMKMANGLTLYEMTGDLVDRWGEEFRGKYGYSDIGAVVGATYPEQGTNLRKRLPHVFFLVPGYGAQGATAQDLRGCFDKDGLGAIVNSSRGIIGAWQSKKYAGSFEAKDFAKASRQAVLDMKADLNSVLG